MLEDADGATINSIDQKCIEHTVALHELLPSWPTPTQPVAADMQAVAGRCLITLEWLHADTQRKLTLCDCFFSARVKDVKIELIMLLHKLLLGHLQNDQLNVLGLVLLGLHSVTQAVFTFPACIHEVDELCCAIAQRFTTDKGLLAVEDESMLGFWFPGRAGLQAFCSMLGKLE